MLSSTMLLLPFAGILATSSASPTLLDRQVSSLSTFITQEQQVSLNGVLLNIGGLNSTWVEGASPGVVVASPSTCVQHLLSIPFQS
jgi:hypothetical protein